VFSTMKQTCVAHRAKKATANLCRGGLSFQFRAHDLRRTVASYMGEAGVDRFHIALVLNHRSVTHNSVTAIYDRYRYDRKNEGATEVGEAASRDREAPTLEAIWGKHLKLVGAEGFEPPTLWSQTRAVISLPAESLGTLRNGVHDRTKSAQGS
jgi:hypothetical protein